MSGPIGASSWLYNSNSDFYPYTIDQSLRLNDDDNAYLNITYGSSGTSTALGTFSWWMKRSALGGSQDNIYFEAGGAGGIQLRSDKLAVNSFDSSNTQVIVQTDVVLRDPSAWYHCVVSVNGNAGTIKFYINGVEQAQTVTNGSLVSGRSWDFLNHDSRYSFKISNTGSNKFDGYLAEYHYIDGTALDATSFGETKNGVWVAKAYSGSYGTNGFFLPFDDSSAIGDDESSNTNDWTANNLDAHDVMPDSPTGKNFATLNPLFNSVSQAVLSEGNLKAATAGFSSSAYGYGATSTFAIPKDKKIYIEVECTDTTGDNWFAGFATKTSIETGVGGNTGSDGAINVYNRSIKLNGTEIDYGSSAGLGGLGVANLAAGDILGCAIDGATGKVWFSRNGTYFKSPTTDDSGTTGNPSAGSNEIGTLTGGTSDDVFFVLGGGTSANNIFVNFGQDSVNVSSAAADANGLGTFEYAPPTDYVCLAASSLSEPTIGPNSTKQADDYFNTVLYTGDGSSSNAITGVGFQPDWVWLKQRNGTNTHQLLDVVRGKIGAAASFARLRTDTTAVEATPGSDSGLLSLDSDGYTLGTDGAYNGSSSTYVAWNWKAGGTAVSNTDGSITSQVSAATDAGFSIATFTMPDAQKTIGHGLGVKPDMIIFKLRSSGSWMVWHNSFGENTNNVVLLNTTAAKVDSGGSAGNWFRGITSTTTEIKTAGSYAGTGDYVMYSFANVPGYQDIGTYVGNGNADGTVVYTGFRPAWLIVKRTNSSGGWHMFDNKRAFAGNEIDVRLEADNNDAENTSGPPHIDFLSNGFKLRTTFDNMNASGSTYIYLSFAEQPFKFANAR